MVFLSVFPPKRGNGGPGGVPGRSRGWRWVCEDLRGKTVRLRKGYSNSYSKPPRTGVHWAKKKGGTVKKTAQNLSNQRGCKRSAQTVVPKNLKKKTLFGGGAPKREGQKKKNLVGRNITFSHLGDPHQKKKKEYREKIKRKDGRENILNPNTLTVGAY